MNIDERLEALAQSVELLVSLHKDIEKAWRDHEVRMEKRDAQMEKRDARIDQLHADMMLAMARLAQRPNRTTEN